MTDTLSTQFQASLTRCGIDLQALQGTDITVRSPIDGSQLAQLAALPAAQMPELMERATQAFKQWRLVPAPLRGELVRLWGEELRRTKADVGHIVSCEVGKIV